MCRLFGFRSSVLSRAHRSLVEAQNALRHQAREHRDGWGIGYFHGRDAFVLKSEAGAAADDSFARASERLASHTFVVHVRRATVGAVNANNVHPFRCGRWVFAHNGTVFGFDRVGPRLREQTPDHLRSRVLGTTDTETLFHWLLGHVERAGLDPTGHDAADPARLGAALAAAVIALRALAVDEGAERPVANFILTNGSVFVANRHGRELFLATQKFHCRDADTCAAEKICLQEARPSHVAGGARVNHLIVASEQIGDEDRWEEVPDGELLVLSPDFRLTRGPVEAWV
jgi:predicted glutamine amidotransferase